MERLLEVLAFSTFGHFGIEAEGNWKLFRKNVKETKSIGIVSDKSMPFYASFCKARFDFSKLHGPMSLLLF